MLFGYLLSQWRELANLEIAKEMGIINAAISGTIGMGKDISNKAAAARVGGIPVGMTLSNAAALFSQVATAPMPKQSVVKKESTIRYLGIPPFVYHAKICI